MEYPVLNKSLIIKKIHDAPFSVSVGFEIEKLGVFLGADSFIITGLTSYYYKKHGKQRCGKEGTKERSHLGDY